MKNIQMNVYQLPKKRSIKNKNMKMDMFLQSNFNFSYAGKCSIFISKQKNSYYVVHQNVHIVEDIFLFCPNYYAKFKFEDLYCAILGFNKSVKIILSSMDWYTPDLFETKGIDYSEVFLE